MDFRLELGGRVKDRITGFTGIVVARAQWLNGCVRYLVTDEKVSDDGTVKELWIDEPQLEFIQQVHEPNLWPADAETGLKPQRAGPRNDPSR